MTQRSKAQWRELIAQQKSSGLIAAEFCRQNLINAKYFSLQKRRLSEDTSGFVKAMSVIRKSPLDSSGLVTLRVVEFVVPFESVVDVVSGLLSRS